MKNKLNLTAKTTSKLTLRNSLIYAAAGLGIMAILFTGAFLYFNLGNSEEAKASNGITSKADGPWYNANTWNNWSNPSYNNQPEWQAGTFYIKHHVSYGDLRLKSGNTLVVEGLLEVNSIESNDQLRIEVKSGGKLIVNGDIRGKANFNLYIDEDASLEANNISGDDQLKIYNRGSLLANGHISGKANFDLHVYENASLEANNISGDNQFKIYNSGKFNAQGGISVKNGFSITSSRTFEVGSITAGNQFKVDNSGTFVSLGDIISGNNTEINNNNRLIVIGGVDTGNQSSITSSGSTVVTGDLNSGLGFGFPNNNLYVYKDFTTLLYWDGQQVPDVKDGSNLYNDSRDLYDIVQQLLNGGSLLPIVLAEFQASMTDSQTVQVEWATFSEKNNDFFTVERSADGKNFEVLTTVAGAGNSNKKSHYSFEDKGPLAGYSYYRLKQTDFNGDFEYFKIVGVNNSHGQEGLTAKSIHVNDAWPNPFTDHLNITFDAEIEGEVEVLVQNVFGEIVHKRYFQFNHGENTYAFDRTETLKPGVYFVTLGKGGKKITTQKVIKI